MGSRLNRVGPQAGAGAGAQEDRTHPAYTEVLASSSRDAKLIKRASQGFCFLCTRYSFIKTTHVEFTGKLWLGAECWSADSDC